MRPILIALLMPLAACGGMHDGDSTPGIVGTGTGGTRSYAATNFTGIAVAGPDDVDVRVGSAFSVRAEGDAGVLDRLRIAVKGDSLQIGRRRSAGLSWGSKGAVKVYVTMPRLATASLAGSGDLAVDRVDGTGFTGSIAGSGDLAIGALSVQEVDLSIAGAGDVGISGGTARRLALSIAGAGNIDAARVTAAEASVDIAGSGNVRATVNGAAKVSIVGSGDVDLGPHARCAVTKTGSGSVRCG